MVNNGENLLDDCFKTKIKKAVHDYLVDLQTEKVCEYDPAEFNKKPIPLGRWDRLITEQNIRVDTVKKIITLIDDVT